jgi:hypothetical protein
LALKKYFRRCRPGFSKMPDKEDAAAALGNSEELSVQNSVGDPIPEFRQRPDDGTHVASPVRRQKSRDVFADEPAGACFVKKSCDVPPQP